MTRLENGKQLARERSNQDASASNAYARAAAQLSILINGGAGTAVLAYLSRGQSANSSFFYHTSRWALIGYSSGVLFGALMMFLMTFCVEQWAEYWREKADGTSDNKAKAAEGRATKWGCKAYLCFWISMLCFVVSSVWLGISLP